MIEKDSLNFEFSGGLKTRGRCERMRGSLDKGPACPSLAVRGPQENRRRLGPFYKRGLEEWTKGGREESEWGGSSNNERLTTCKSCLTLELAPELSVNLKKELRC